MIAMVSSTFQPSALGPRSRALASGRAGCNPNAARAVLFAIGLLTLARPAAAQRDVALFFGGAAVGLAAHEAGHLVADGALGAAPGLRKVTFGGIPFFAITHPPVSSGREFIISSAGFWVQHGTDEVLLHQRPSLRARRSPFLTGVFAFNVLTSVGYAAAAFTHAGPIERDTRGMALSSDVPEPTIGVLLLAPALLDGWRYYDETRWAKWGSRAVKVAGALLAIKARAD